MTIQDQYIETFRQTQDTWTDVAKSFSNDVQRAFGQASAPFSYVDPNKSIDQVFDFWEKAAKEQREVAKQLLGATTSAGEKIRQHVESVSAAARENADSVSQAMREQADSVTATFNSVATTLRAQAAKTYTV